MNRNRLQVISELFKEYRLKKVNKQPLLEMVDEVEMAERVYNSNAIENSTLTLPETEKILMQIESGKHMSLREVFEAKNLALVYGYVKKTAPEKSLTMDMFLLLHKMLLTNIRDTVAGRFREGNEMVRVGTHIGVPSEFVLWRLREAMAQYESDIVTAEVHKIARIHAEFENIHPFVDGNGRIGRVVNNYLLIRAGFPPIIVRNKEKQAYYSALRAYDASHNIKPMIRVFELALLESLHKRLAYLDGLQIITLAEYAKAKFLSQHNLLNAARRQTIPAFREKGVWKIGKSI
ncbi:MAG: Fic family protein [Patescibacteria group bacterium]